MSRPPAQSHIVHFAFLTAAQRQEIFVEEPAYVSRDSPRDVLADSLGATLYTPAHHPELGKRLEKALGAGSTSTVVCLEDAVPDGELGFAEDNLVRQLSTLASVEMTPDLPLLFVRVRSREQIDLLTRRLGPAARLLTGFVLPKFTAGEGAAWLDTVAEAGVTVGRHLYAMPVLEGPDVLYPERRRQELAALKTLFDLRRDLILTVRIGGTDLCGLLGLRRASDESIYDLAPIRDCIGDIVGVFSRAEGRQVISGPVWEYYTPRPRIWKPQLRQSLFDRYDVSGSDLRTRIIGRHLDGLIAEVLLDRAHGLVGKTVIHPTHVRAVNALSVVDYEELADARQVLDGQEGGASASEHGNKMNERKPHRLWAERVLRRARTFGVYRDDVSFVEILNA